MNNLYLQNLMELDMDILEVDDIVIGTWWGEDHISSPYTRIYMMTEGTAFLQCGEETVTMTPGHIYVIPAGYTFSFRCENDFSKIYFHVSIKRKDGYDVFEGTNRIFIFNDPKAIQSMKNNFPLDSVSKVLEARSGIYSVLCRCMRKLEDPELGRYSDQTNEIINYIEENLNCSITVEKVADALFLSPARVRRIFRQETGLSIGRFIDDRIMFAAEKEIRTGNATIHDISNSFGFCDQFYFSRCFSKKFGVSPQQYRKVHRFKGYSNQ